MAQGPSARVVGLGKVDPIFSRIRLEAEETVRKEPELAGFFMASLLNHETLESAIVHRVAARLDHPDVGGHLIRQTYLEIISRDPGELLIERIEANAADENSSGSGLGLLTLMNDYGARLGWDFRSSTSGSAVTLSTHAALTLN